MVVRLREGYEDVESLYGRINALTARLEASLELRRKLEARLCEERRRAERLEEELRKVWGEVPRLGL